jgi:hypothetical protein
MEFKGTKGEWISRYNGNYWEVNREEDFTDGQRLAISIFVLDIIGDKCETNRSGESEANAQIISSAPELLNACQLALGGIDPKSDIGKQIKKAINKALGKEADDE